MKNTKLWWLLPLACLAACSNGGNHSKYADRAEAAATVNADSTQVVPLNSPERKVIRNADFDCKVQNVMTAVNDLERMVTGVGGVVQDSKVENTSGEATTTYYKPDSLRRYQTYNTTAYLTLRVPVAYLDSVVHAIPGMVVFIDSRSLRQSDVTAHYVGNELKTAVGTKVYSAGNAVKLAKKPEDLIAVQEYEDQNTQQLIARKMENMQIMDQVSYSTLTIALAQPPQVLVQTMVNPGYVSAVPFLVRLRTSVTGGWDVVTDVFVALISIWPFILLVTFGWFTYKRLKTLYPRFSKAA